MKKEIVYCKNFNMRSTLDQNTRDLLAKDLGIKEEKDKATMISEVESCLGFYHHFVIPSGFKSTEQSVDAIKSIKKHAYALLKELNHLKYPGETRLRLYTYSFFGLPQPEAARGKLVWDWEFEPQRAAVLRIYRMAHGTLSLLEYQVKKGRPNSYFYLGQTMKELAEVFDVYNQSNRYINKKRIKFIVAVLDAANIPHPKTVSTKWYNLLKKFRPLKFSKQKNN